MKRIVLAAMVLLCSFAVPTASAQQTTGNISGRLVDAQGSAVARVTVTAKTATTGFSRTDVSDVEGLYRLTGLTVGVCLLTLDLTGCARFVSNQIDGGDNNDDTVGRLLQLFPLEASQECNFVTQRYKAEYGRSNGGVMNIVTKSGTNNFAGSGFLNFRDKSLNSSTFTEKLN